MLLATSTVPDVLVPRKALSASVLVLALVAALLAGEGADDIAGAVHDHSTG